MLCLLVTTVVPSSPTKASLYGAILFTLQQTRWLPVSKASLIFIFTMFMVSCKVSLPVLTYAQLPLLSWGLRLTALGVQERTALCGGWRVGSLPVGSYMEEGLRVVSSMWGQERGNKFFPAGSPT